MGGIIFVLRDGGVGDAGDGFGPGERGAFALIEQGPGLTPGLHEDQLLDGEPLFEEVAGMQVDAIGAAVDLRDPQIDQIDQRAGQPRLRDVAVNATERLQASRGDLGVVQTLGHCGVLKKGVLRGSLASSALCRDMSSVPQPGFAAFRRS